ncbi:MAG: ABC transporter permease, partial [Nitrospira sp.]|nr:ABC transporter permease [Nitrospira sp.]
WISVGAVLFHLGIGCVVLLGFQLASGHALNWTAVTFPFLLVPVMLYVLGASWFLASIGVFVRDVGHAIGVLTNLMLFLAPVFYPLSSVPDPYRPLMYLNPLTFVVEQSRNVLILGQLPSWSGLLVYSLCGVAVSSLGLIWFERTRKGFADVL